MTEAQLTGTAVAEVAALAQKADHASLKTIDIGGRRYSTVPLHLIDPLPKQPVPESLKVSTLTGLRDYIEVNPDALDLSKNVLHVVGPTLVALRSAILENSPAQRMVPIIAEASDRFASNATPFRFGNFISREDMTVALLTLFEQESGDLKLLQRLVGNVQDEAIKTEKDDGVSQTVVARASIAGLEQITVPNPIKVAPFRTFPEIAQPVSLFTFRLKQGPAGMVAALFEADGGAWRQTAIASIARWLREHVSQVQVIA